MAQGGIDQAVVSPRSRSADRKQSTPLSNCTVLIQTIVSGRVSVLSDRAAIEGRCLDIYLGEWTNDSTPVCTVLLAIRLTLNHIRLPLLASGTSPQLFKWQVQILYDMQPLVLLRPFTALQKEGRIMAWSSTSKRSQVLWSCQNRRYCLFGMSSNITKNDILTHL